jgi:hypothetical protein
MEYEQIIEEYFYKLYNELNDFNSHYKKLYKELEVDIDSIKFNYFSIQKYILLSIQNLETHDSRVVDDVMRKKIKSIKDLDKFYTTFTKFKKPKEATTLYLHNNNKIKKHIMSQNFATKKEKEEYIRKIQLYFFKKYGKYFTEVRDSTEAILNIKCYLLNKIFWYKVNKSQQLNDYFKHLKKKPPYTLKTFLYMHTGNTTQSVRNVSEKEIIDEYLSYIEN